MKVKMNAPKNSLLSENISIYTRDLKFFYLVWMRFWKLGVLTLSPSFSSDPYLLLHI